MFEWIGNNFKFVAKKLSTKKIMILIFFVVLGLNFSVHPVFAFYGKDLEKINQIILEQQSLNQKIEAKIIEDKTIEKLITSIDIKKEVADEKEHAYDKAINQSKWLIIFFGGLCLIVLTGLGLWHNKQLKTKKEELEKLYNIHVYGLKKENYNNGFKKDLDRREELIIYKNELDEKMNKRVCSIKRDLQKEVFDYIKREEEKNTNKNNIIEVENKKSEINEEDNILDEEEIEL